MATNQFLPFAVGAGANALTPTAYAALTALLASGFQAGTASSAQINTVLRQASTVAAAVAKFIEGQGYDALDNGDHMALAVALRSAVSGSSTPSGAVAPFATASAPNGWLKCNGAAVSRTTYAALFAAIGTAFGAGNGTTTFNLPDLRGEFVRGWDDGRGVDSGRSLGAQQPGTHGVNGTFWGLSRNAGPAVGGDFSVAQTVDAYVGGSAAAFQHQQVTITSPETRPRNVALLYCIKF